jgi:hypothetical protein
MIKKLISMTVLAVTVLLSACSSEDILVTPENQNVNTFSTETPDNATILSPEVKGFVSSVSRLGVNLNNEQLKTIEIQRNLKPSGKFASRPANNLTSDKNLEVHFQKHKSQFKGVTSKEMYLQRALGFFERESDTIQYYFDSTSFAKGYQSNVVRFDSKTREISALRSDGDLTTYYISDDLSPKRFVVVPENFRI